MKYTILLLTLICSLPSNGQNESRINDGVTINIETLGTASSDDNAPLWLTSNKHGLVSPYSNSSYERVSLTRDLSIDSLRRWQRGYGVDLQFSQNSQSELFLHQAYIQVGLQKAVLTLGSKEHDIDLRNNELTSGGLSQGINARPIPEALLSIDYFSIPYTNHWWKWKGRAGFGMTTDGAWQEDWVRDKQTMKYTSNTLFHEKALYWKLGREEVFPFTYEIGIQMFNIFGGTAYNVVGRGTEGTTTIEQPTDFNAFWHAFMPVGSNDVTDGVNKNSAGNTLGSYNMRLQYNSDSWTIGAYFERFYEDHSMLTVQYGIYDHLIGIDAKLPKNKYVSHALAEHISTKDQSGAVYHDGTNNIPDAIAGRDNYYHHHIYSGWQHWGYSIGNPLITSPIYNADKQLTFHNNRIQAWHFGLDGDPAPQLHWRALATFTRNWGTYAEPYPEIENEQHYLIEARYSPSQMRGVSSTLSLGLSHGAIIGNTFGVQLSIRKSLNL